MTRARRAAIAGAGIAVAAGAIFFFAHRGTRARDAVPLREVHVPHATEQTKVDGELDEPMWRAAAREIFGTRPYSDVRLAWGNGALHVGLYASDHDIVTAHVAPDGPVWRGDAFHLVVTTKAASYAFDVDPRCTLTDGTRKDKGAWSYAWQSGAKLACDADGTIDTPGDNDEEWVVEMDIPLAAIGLEEKSGARAELFVRRCDLRETGGKPIDMPCPESSFAILLD